MEKKACGLDVHKESVFACILDEQGKKIFEKRFGTLTLDLIALRYTLVEYGCGRAAMKSTSIYWMPIWHILDSDFELTLVNPYFINQLQRCNIRFSNNETFYLLLFCALSSWIFLWQARHVAPEK